MKNPRTPKGGAMPFTAEEFRYRADEFLTSGHDDHGQSIRLFFRCPPALERSLEVVRDSHRFPYSTITDIIRHAVIRHMEWLYQLEPDMPRHFLSGLSAINEITRDADMLNSMQATFDKVDSLIEGYFAKGETLEGQRLLSTTRGQLSKLPDTRWKREFSEVFSRKYARHLPALVSGTGTGTSTLPGPNVHQFPSTSTSHPHSPTTYPDTEPGYPGDGNDTEELDGDGDGDGDGTD